MSNNNANFGANVVIPVMVGSQKAYAIVSPATGLWAHRSSGQTIYAFKYEKAQELVSKITGWTVVPPQGFSGFGHEAKAAAPKAAPTPKAEAPTEPKPRSVAQAAAWLAICERNLARCEAGLRGEEGGIGGNVEKYRKGVETARQTLADAKAREAAK